jgi:two-component system, chemotaxis family, chemotaxis protein CheY
VNQSPKILLIEDDADLADAIAEILTMEGYRIVYASDGMAALAVLTESELPDLILLDLMMPKMSGWEFREAQMRDYRLSRIPVVVLSATGERSRPIDATRVLRKPVTLDALLATVDEFVRIHQEY